MGSKPGGPQSAKLKPVKNKRGPGRPKGLKNKLPTEIRARVVAIWDKLDADKEKSLLALSRKEPKWFFENFGRAVIPKDIKIEAHLSDEMRAEAQRMFSEYLKGRK